MLYILNISYEPNTAAANRLLGYYAALDELHKETEVVYLLPNAQRSTVKENYNNVRISYYWKGWIRDSKLFRRLKFFKFFKFFLFYIGLLRVVLKIKRGDIVYTYGMNKATYWMSKVRGIRVFAERTEHPDVFTNTNKLTGITNKEEKFILRNLTGLFVISEPLRDYYISQGLKAEQVLIANMIVDPKRFKSLKRTVTAHRYIAYCGTASNNKDGVDKLLRSFAMIAQKYADVYLYIIGKTPSKRDESGNLKLMEDLDITEKVIFTGLVKADEMPQLLKNAEVLALARPDNKQARYGFPTKLGEYLLTGNPVIVTNVGDIPKFLKDGESALLSSPIDDEEFANKLEWLLENKSRALEIGARGALVALEYFSNVNVMSKMLKHIDSLC